MKDPAIIRNPLLDGLLGNVSGLRNGRNSLRIDLLSPLAIPSGAAPSSPSPASSSGGGGTPYGGRSGGTSSRSGIDPNPNLREQ